MGVFEWRLAIDEVLFFKLLQRAPFRILQGPVDDFPRRHLKARMGRADSMGEVADDVVIGAAFAGRVDQFWA